MIYKHLGQRRQVTGTESDAGYIRSSGQDNTKGSCEQYLHMYTLGHPPRVTHEVVLKCLGLQRGTDFLMAFLTLQHVGAAQLGGRQNNPGFITALPTVATSPNPPQLPGPPRPIFTPTSSTIDTASPPSLVPPAVLPSSIQISSTTPQITLFQPTATLPSQAATSAAQVINDHYFGGIPRPSPDAPVTGIFLVLFILGALVFGWIYWKNAKRPIKGSNGDRLSALMICFCLAEALVCVFRLSWASTDTQPAVIFLALVSESIGSVSLFTVNFLLTSRLVRIFDLRSSLWTRSIIASAVKYAMTIACSLVILLHVLGAGLHEFNRNAGGVEKSGARLLQASTGLLMITGFIFLVVVLAASTAANRTRVEKSGARMAVYLVGAGTLTMTSQIARFASTFIIWRPTDQTSIGILSRPVYYITGFGMSASIITLYAASRIDLLFGKRSTSNGRSSPQP
ncbi:hypothetical protein DHEL01_v211897 [Diaporthe helianthi]|uniref:Uncharacterized protein n=1 Tax=Diaporthe helianthi TaxID=158607 RepID=A0A2P5HHH8_DIAHE|nr:hypothetical protein DHEL01_v211897 [Diaporthe helianthi]